MTDALKPCPFCDGPTKAYFAERIFCTTREVLWSCECVNDNARCMIGPSSEQMPYEDMVAVWNTRPTEDALAAERDALAAEVERLRARVTELGAMQMVLDGAACIRFARGVSIRPDDETPGRVVVSCQPDLELSNHASPASNLAEKANENSGPE